MKKILITALTISVCACASNPDKIDTAYVSPLTYSKYDCSQISQEMTHVQRRTTELYGRLKKERKKDNWMMGIGMVVFWPSLFALSGGDGPEAAEYAQLKGQYEALRQVSIEKKCVNVSVMSPEDIIKAADRMKENPATSADPVASTNADVPKLRSVSDVRKEECEFLNTISKGTGGGVDSSENLEKAMNAALRQAGMEGADSFFIVDTETTSSGASVILEALKCNGAE
ncbi:MAG: hypothetical protein V2I48_06915 [Xanthomonadales bacterium]|jgi:hypothetical protein|nr:hypothetical protein [Xanthomonadales bacterium]